MNTVVVFLLGLIAGQSIILSFTLISIKHILELMQMEQKIMIGDSVRTNKKLMEFFDLYK